MQEFDYGRIAFFSDGKVYDIIMGERMPKLQEKKKQTSSRNLRTGYGYYQLRVNIPRVEIGVT